MYCSAFSIRAWPSPGQIIPLPAISQNEGQFSGGLTAQERPSRKVVFRLGCFFKPFGSSALLSRLRARFAPTQRGDDAQDREEGSRPVTNAEGGNDGVHAALAGFAVQGKLEKRVEWHKADEHRAGNANAQQDRK